MVYMDLKDMQKKAESDPAMELEGTTRARATPHVEEQQQQQQRRQRPLPPTRKSSPLGCFGLQTASLVLVGVAICLLVLPLILPPLPPPPLVLLLLPLGMIGVLLVLAFMPSDHRIASSSSYL